MSCYFSMHEQYVHLRLLSIYPYVLVLSAVLFVDQFGKATVYLSIGSHSVCRAVC